MGYTAETYAEASDQDDIVPLLDTLGGWARMAAEEFHYAKRGRWTIASARDFLSRQHELICRQPWADDYAEELHKAWKTAMTLAGRWESPQHLDGRYCPWCESNALYQSPGEDAIDCQVRAGGCGRWMTREDYDRMCGMRAAYAKKSGVA
jgi:hypothetical protein